MKLVNQSREVIQTTVESMARHLASKYFADDIEIIHINFSKVSESTYLFFYSRKHNQFKGVRISGHVNRNTHRKTATLVDYPTVYALKQYFFKLYGQPENTIRPRQETVDAMNWYIARRGKLYLLGDTLYESVGRKRYPVTDNVALKKWDTLRLNNLLTIEYDPKSVYVGINVSYTMSAIRKRMNEALAESEKRGQAKMLANQKSKKPRLVATIDIDAKCVRLVVPENLVDVVEVGHLVSAIDFTDDNAFYQGYVQTLTLEDNQLPKVRVANDITVEKRKKYDKLSEDERIALVRRKPFNIQFMNYPQETVRFEAVKADRRAINCIKNKSGYVFETIVRAFPDALRYLDNPPINLQLKVIEDNPENIQHIEHPSLLVQRRAVKANGLVIAHISNPANTIQLEALVSNPKAIEMIAQPSDEAIAYVKTLSK